MTEQATLPLQCGPRLTRLEKFERFRRAHPEVERELVRLAREAKASGLRKVGIRLCWERCRWSMRIEKRNGERYAMNNDHAKFYSREIMRRYADLDGFFETRGEK